jgi:hypothetical protein
VALFVEGDDVDKKKPDPTIYIKAAQVRPKPLASIDILIYASHLHCILYLTLHMAIVLF